MLEANVSLLPYNTFGIAAKARLFARFASVEELRTLLSLPEVQEAEKLVLGGGSNLLFTKDFEGVVLKNEILGLDILSEDAAIGTALVRAGAGESWHGLVLFALEQDLSGIENLSLIPGTVGAAPLQNIGAYGSELQDTFAYLEAVELSTGALRTFDRTACGFGYRESVFKGPLKNQFIVTSVVFQLLREAQPNVSYGAISTTLQDMGLAPDTPPTPRQVSEAIISIRRSKLPDPTEIGNAGSFFKNPELSQHKYDELKATHPDLPGYPMPGGVKVPAAWLIEQSGWKGYRQGQHGVHDRQALVLVNHGGAQGADIQTLAYEIIASVRAKFGVELHPEVNIM